ncbi:S-layer homology domain-containing protein [Bacillus infantis]|uniref:S-layer homology domain-containing protein n=1 Tax=Bacillus infantis TaxID=324767 RepID=UPI003CE76990
MKNIKSIFVLILLSMMVFQAVPPLNAKAAEVSFKDVKAGHWAAEEIGYLTNWIVNGYEDGTFRPESKLKRIHVATMLDRYFNYQLEYEDNPNVQVKDVPEGDVNYDIVQAVLKSGIFKSVVKDQKFMPYQNITRGEMALVLASAFGFSGKTDHEIQDVKPGTELYAAIQSLVAEDITVLYEGKNFNPNSVLNRGQFTAFMARSLNDYFKPGSKKPITGKDTLFWSDWDGSYITALDTNETKVFDPKHVVGSIYTVGDWVYYIKETYRNDYGSGTAQGQIYRMKKDGSQKTRISAETVESFAVWSGGILYSMPEVRDSEWNVVTPQQIKSMNLDGSAAKVLINGAGSLFLEESDGWYFYVNEEESQLYKMKHDGSQNMTVSETAVERYDIWGNVPGYLIHQVHTEDGFGMNVVNLANGMEFYLPSFEVELLAMDGMTAYAIQSDWDENTGENSNSIIKFDLNNPASTELLMEYEYGDYEYMGVAHGELVFINKNSGEMKKLKM